MSSSEIARNIARFGCFRSRAATHPGAAGRHNEDAYLNRPDLGLWAVTDGAGGHEAGEVASAEVVGQLDGITAGLSAADMLQEVRARLEAAHARLREKASQQGSDIVMATTAVVVLASDDYFACLWVGDSPAYLLRAGTLTKITRDHSLVQELVEGGIISETEAVHHPQANVITRAVGADTDALDLDKRTGQLMLGDRLLLCSDGLSKTLSNERLAELLAMDGEDSAERVVMAAVEARATDNVTAVTIDFDGAVNLQAAPDGAPGASVDDHPAAAHDDGATVDAQATEAGAEHAATARDSN
jgi:protein phosphatase/serine/threonine-protein phosphatase Stp1